VTSSDAPRPPGGPLREDAPEGGLVPGDDDLDDLSEGSSEHGADDPSGDPPGISHEPEQSDRDAGLQKENAETSLDQPSS
jgi:hypothetical protein